MNNAETLAFLKGQKEGLRLFKVELKFIRDSIEERLKIIREQIKELEN